MKELSGYEYRLELVPVGKIFCKWRAAQRETKLKSFRAKSKMEFNPDVLGALIVCEVENGMFHCIDGLHRRDFIVETLNDPTYKVPCIVIADCDEQKAADIFVQINKARRPPTAIEIFQGNLTAQHPDETKVYEIIRNNGYDISTSTTPAKLRAIKTAMAVYQKHGAQGLDQTLALIRLTWADDQIALDGAILTALSGLLADVAGAINTARFARTIAKKFTPTRLIGAAKSSREMFGGNVARAIRRLLVESYNLGLHAGRLPTD